MFVVKDTGVRTGLGAYAEVAHLAAAVESLREDAAAIAPRLHGRTVWMVNSTAQGGGVAELLPPQIALLRELGVDVRWAVIESDDPEFFAFTKRLHNLIHDADEVHPTPRDRELYEEVSRQNADAIREVVDLDDILVVHDPQPFAAGTLVHRARGVRSIWRCHIGLDEHTPNTRAAWEFLRPYAEGYDRAVFSLEEYVPSFLQERATIIHPSIDPLSHKNRTLSLHKLVGILCDTGLTVPHWPLLEPTFPASAQRLQVDGTWAPATQPEDIGLLARPIVTQVSRWDRLKGFAPLLEAFRILKCDRDGAPVKDARHARRLENVRLVLAGPDPASIQDDPEALQVLDALSQQYLALPESVQRDVALLTLPMQSRKHNALMVNALQRASDIVVQNSLREGFGLTVTEGMWKHTAILGSGRAAGVRLQIRDGVDGCLVPDPEDAPALARTLHQMLGDSDRLEDWGRNAQRRAHDEFLIFSELRAWLRLFVAAA